MYADAVMRMMKNMERTTQDTVHRCIKIYLRNAGDRPRGRNARKLMAEDGNSEQEETEDVLKLQRKMATSGSNIEY